MPPWFVPANQKITATLTIVLGLAGTLAVVLTQLNTIDGKVDDIRAGADQPTRQSWYIAPWGDDANPGDHPQAPWQTLQYALVTNTTPAPGDTFYCLTGVWENGIEPRNVSPRPALSGPDKQTMTVISNYRGSKPVFDASANYPNEQGAFFIQSSTTTQRHGFQFKGLTFRNYFDPDTTNNGRTGIIYQTNQLTAVGDTLVGVDVIGCTFTCDDTGPMGSLGRIVSPVRFFSTSGDPRENVIYGPIVRDNIMERVGDHGIYYANIPHAVIANNQVRSELRFNVNQPDGPDGIISDAREPEGLTIIGNTITGFDHGMNIRGSGMVVRENRIHDINDDGIFLDSSGSAGRSYDNVIEENVIWNTGDEGLDLRGTGIVRRNTLWRWNDNGIAFTAFSYNWWVYDNIFVDACLCNPDESPQTPNYVVIADNTDPGYFRFDHNIYYDPQGATWIDDRPGGPGELFTFQEWQSVGNDPNGFNTSPVFQDTTRTPPNLHPSGTGGMFTPAYGNGEWGGTIGSLPCYDKWIWEVSTRSGRADSASFVLLDENRSVRQVLPPGAVFKRGESYLVDTEPPGFTEGGGLLPQRLSRVFGEWTLFQPTLWPRGTEVIMQTVDPTIIPSPCITGTGDPVEIYFVDSVTFQPVAEVTNRVYQEKVPEYAGLWDNKSSNIDGYLAVLRDIQSTYYGIAYVPTRWQTKEYTINPGETVIQVQLDAVPVISSPTPELCVVNIATIDFQGQVVEGIRVEATFEGSGATSGDLIYQYQSVECITDVNGTCNVELVRSVNIDTPDGIDTYTFTMTDTNTPATNPPITFRRITIPDQASASLGDLVP